MSKPTQFLRSAFWPLLGLALFFVVISLANAQGPLTDGLQNILGRDLPSFQSPEGTTGEALAASAIQRAVRIVKFVVGGVALLLGIIFAFNLVFARGREEAITKQKQNFLYVFIGFVILMVADEVSQVFSAERATREEIVDIPGALETIANVVNYLKFLFGSIIVLIMTISGLRMMTAGGNEEVISKEKRHLVWSGIGIMVILLASNIVNAIYVVNEQGEVAPAEATTAVTEIGSVIRLILTFLGPIAVLYTIYAGFLYLTALENEDRAKKARRMIVVGVTAIIIIYAAFALVSSLIGISGLQLPTTF